MPVHDPGPAAVTGTAGAAEHDTAHADLTGTDPGPGAAAAGPAAPGRAAPGRGGKDEAAGRGGPGFLPELVGRVPPRWRLPLATYAACQVIFLVWWAAFYPAIVSYDSVFYVLHVTTGPWVDNHSVLYDSMVWLSLHLTGGLAALTLAQTAAMSAALGYTVAAFRWLGVPGRWTAIAAVVVAALPPTGIFIVYLWKDVPYVICGFLIVPTVAHLLSLRGRPHWRRDPRVNWLIAVLGLEMLGMSLFRLNGFSVVAITVIPLVCLLSGIRVRLAAAAISAICLALLLNLVVYPAVGIQRAPADLVYGPTYADLAVAYSRDPGSFTGGDKALLAQVMPLTIWQSRKLLRLGYDDQDQSGQGDYSEAEQEPALALGPGAAQITAAHPGCPDLPQLYRLEHVPGSQAGRDPDSAALATRQDLADGAAQSLPHGAVLPPALRDAAHARQDAVECQHDTAAGLAPLPRRVLGLPVLSRAIPLRPGSPELGPAVTRGGRGRPAASAAARHARAGLPLHDRRDFHRHHAGAAPVRPAPSRAADGDP